MRMRSRRGSWGRIFCGSRHLRHGRVRKTCFVKCNMPRNYNASGFKVKTPVAFVLAWVSEKDAPCGSWRQFVSGGGMEIWIA
jgi:hypothetical protein